MTDSSKIPSSPVSVSPKNAFLNDSRARKTKIDSKDFRVAPGKKVDLGKLPTIVDPYYKSKKQHKELLLEHMEKSSSLQQLHYASNQFALLVIFQGMDGAGKDGAIRHVMSGVNPEGCEVYSFKQPSTEELQHDFLWRSTCRLPERGRIGIFNRSYYEEVLIVRVHPEILNSEGLSKEFRDAKNIWKERYRSIRDLEGHLYRNATRTIKIFLHLSRDEHESDSSNASMNQRKTGKSASPTFTRGSLGGITWRPTKSAWRRRAPATRPGMRSRQTTRRMPA